jgi:hypothetical protein
MPIRAHPSRIAYTETRLVNDGPNSLQSRQNSRFAPDGGVARPQAAGFESSPGTATRPPLTTSINPWPKQASACTCPGRHRSAIGTFNFNNGSVRPNQKERSSPVYVRHPITSWNQRLWPILATIPLRWLPIDDSPYRPFRSRCREQPHRRSIAHRVPAGIDPQASKIGRRRATLGAADEEDETCGRRPSSDPNSSSRRTRR